MQIVKTLLLGAALALAVAVIWAPDTSADELNIAPVVTGLEEPWSVGFLPDGALLITERGGRLLHVVGDERHAVENLPEIAAVGQGGLLDVLVPRDFATTREIFLTLSVPQGSGAGTALARARLSDDARQLIDLRIIFEMAPGSGGGAHFGSRIVEALDGTLYVTVGERNDPPTAQDLNLHNGSIVRIAKDGSVPPDNPFVDNPEARPEIWSYGHRNPQGATLDLDGNLLDVEHGARGGDEINRIEPGANYGWPVISYGTKYSGGKIGEGTAKEGMEQPAFFWDPSIAPSGMMVYSGALQPDWRGDIFVGSLKFDYISRLSGTPLAEVEQLKSPETERVRDVREGPDGAIWFLSVGNGALYRLTP
jgi:glucose/arabinose dehydrogenase